MQKKNISHKICGKTLAVMLAAGMIVGCVSTANALEVGGSDIATLGITGSFNNWGNDGEPDVQMSDDDGDGIYVGYVEIESVTEDMISELYSDGTPTGKSGVQFKIRANGEWDYSWGEYEPEYNRTLNSQTNFCVEDAEVGEELIIKVELDTSNTVLDSEIPSDDPDAYQVWPVFYTVVDRRTMDGDFLKAYETEDGLAYVILDDDTVRIVGAYMASAESGYEFDYSNIIIPAEIDGRTVTSLKGEFLETNNGNHTYGFNVRCFTITIPATVTDLDEFDFLGAGVRAGYGTVIFSEKGTAAEKYANAHNYFFSDIPSDAVTSGNYMYGSYEDGTYIVRYLGDEKNVTVPTEIDGKKINAVGDGAFFGTSIESVTIPGEIKNVSNFAFSCCPNLKKADIQEGVEDLGVNAFRSSALEEVNIPDSARVSSCTFVSTPWYNNQEDEFVIVGDSCWIKYNGSDTKIVVPDGVKLIASPFWGNEEYFDYEGNSEVTEIVLPDSLRYIWGDAFNGLTSLKEIEIPEGVEEIGGAAFANCTSLEKVIIPESVTTMKWDTTFDGSPNVTIYGYAGTRAESYAKENDIPFVALEKKADDTTVVTEESTQVVVTEDTTATTGGTTTTATTTTTTPAATTPVSTATSVPATGSSADTAAAAAVAAIAAGGIILAAAKRRKKED